MTTTNDITGDALRSRPSNDNFNDNFDRIFGKKDNALGRRTRSEPNTVEAAKESARHADGGESSMSDCSGEHGTNNTGVV